MEIIEFNYQDNRYYLKLLEDEGKKYYKYSRFSPTPEEYPFEKYYFFEISSEKEFEYTMGIHEKINEVVNEKIINGTLRSAITSIKFGKNCTNYSRDMRPCIKELNENVIYDSSPCYENNIKNQIMAILPHLVVTGMEEIKPVQFGYCEFLREVTIMPDVKTIGRGAFRECHNLNKVDLMQGVKILEAGCFIETGIKELHLPKSVKFVGVNALLNSKIEKLFIYNMDIQIASENFYNHNNGNPNQEIFIVYDDSIIVEYCEFYNPNVDKNLKTYRTIANNGDRIYITETGYKSVNAKKYERLSEDNWSKHCLEYHKARGMKEKFESKHTIHSNSRKPWAGSYKIVNAWTYKNISLIPISMIDTYSSVFEIIEKNQGYENIVNEIADYETRINKLKELKSVIERAKIMIETDIFVEPDSRTIVPLQVIEYERNSEYLKKKMINLNCNYSNNDKVKY